MSDHARLADTPFPSRGTGSTTPESAGTETGVPERICTSTGNATLEALEETPFPTEDELQALIAEHPELLDGERIRPGDARRWILVTREKGIAPSAGEAARWAVDHLIIDQDAVPTLAKVKRGSNPEIRRTIVGQLLEYAAHASTCSPRSCGRWWSGGWTRSRRTASPKSSRATPSRHGWSGTGWEFSTRTFWWSAFAASSRNWRRCDCLREFVGGLSSRSPEIRSLGHRRQFTLAGNASIWPLVISLWQPSSSGRISQSGSSIAV